MARSARRYPFHPFLQQIRYQATEALFWSFFERRRYWVAEAAAGCFEHPPSRRKIRSSGRERMAARTHAMDQILPFAERPDAHDRSAPGSSRAHLSHDERRRDILDATARAQA